jgi:hypothetical protein
MMTKEEILEKADIPLDLSIVDAKVLGELNKMFGGNYVEHFKKNSEYIEQGINLFLSAVGERVSVWHNGKRKDAVVSKIDYDKGKDCYVMFFEDQGSFSFREGGFACLGRDGEYYGICNDPDKKSGIKFNSNM